ncbi:MAG: dihydroorotate dehydrogenase electron transfer subunit [Defluviitaleaceae bacterium]|nr:dihydroorotate dehydrogenase electron transfer subunit [Defluviitaleaceae bacterium]
MKDVFEAEIISNDQIALDIYDLYIKSPEEVSKAKAGQFVSLFTDNPAMVLPRPLSLCDIDKESGIFRIVYRAGGSGTRQISKYEKGQIIKGIGPVGNSFRILPNTKKFAVVGGGIGTPPLLELCKKIKNEVPDSEIFVYLGFRSVSQVILEEDFKKYSDNVYITTDDGSYGHHGNVISVMKTEPYYDVIYSCGPTIMLKFVAKYADSNDTKCFVSLEEHMACSIGACLACVTKVHTKDGEWAYRRVCCTGPVFNAKEMVWT